MKGFVARNQQALAIAASAAVLVIVAGALTGIILAGRHSNSTAAKPSPSATFDQGIPTLSPSESASPTGAGTPSPGATPSASAAASSSTSAATGRPTATPIAFGNGGAGCLGIANCTPVPRATPTPATVPTPKTGFNDVAVPGGVAFAAAVWPIDGKSVWFSEGSNNMVGVVSATSALKEFTLGGSTTPLGMTFDASGNLWVIEASAKKVVEIASGTLSTAIGPSLGPTKTYPLSATADATAVFNLNPSAGTPLQGITVDKNGDVWFSESQGSSNSPTTPSIGHIPAGAADLSTPQMCALTPDNPYAASPTSIVANAADGKLYVATDHGLGVFTPPAQCVSTPGTKNGAYQQSPPTSGSAVIESVAVDHAGVVWFGTQSGVGHVINGNTPFLNAANASGGMGGNHFGLVEAPDPSQGASATAIWASFQAGATNSGADRVLNNGGVAFPDPSVGTGDDLRSIVSDNAGHLWITDATSNKMIEVTVTKT